MPAGSLRPNVTLGAFVWLARARCSLGRQSGVGGSRWKLNAMVFWRRWFDRLLLVDCRPKPNGLGARKKPPPGEGGGWCELLAEALPEIRGLA